MSELRTADLRPETRTTPPRPGEPRPERPFGRTRRPEPSQRSTDRRRVLGQVDLRESGEGGDPLTYELTEISAAGAFLDTDLLLPVGAPLQMQFRLTGHAAPIDALGRVVRVQDRGHRPGMGIQFDWMDSAARQRLRTLAALG